MGITSGCGYRDSGCDEGIDQPKCGTNGRILWICESSEWQSNPCGEDMLCAYTEKGASCVQGQAVQANCGKEGVKLCTSGGLLQVCQKDGSWRFTVCDATQICQNGSCVDSGVTPVEPKPELKGIARQQCSTDGKSVETVDSDGNITSQTCLDLVGFETQCKTYKTGHAGCELPESCNDVFSEDGTCVGDDILLGCDMDYVIPQPFEQSCQSLGQICRSNHGKSSCMTRCNQPGSSFSCMESEGLELVSHCISLGSDNVLETGTSLCSDDHTSVSCMNGTVNETTCENGETCVANLGICSKLCQQSDLNQVICDSDGYVFQCQAVSDMYVYVSMGKRHCLDDILITCPETNTGYELKETNCRTYMHNGELIECSCQMDYMYPDMDGCVPVVQGDSCNGEKESGHCEGNELVYCVEEDDALVRTNCAQDQDGYSICSQYAGFSDCRRSCSTAGNATCSLSSDGESYYVNLCAPDENNGTLTMIEGDGVCLGNVLYSCDASGTPISKDCSANGGICDASRCVYPACSKVTAPVCMMDDALLSCQMDENGLMIGMTMQTVSCDANGNCIKCENGSVSHFQLPEHQTITD